LAKRLSEKEKEKIFHKFSSGDDISKLSQEFECSKLTISRNLKKFFGEDKYKKLIKINKSKSQTSIHNENKNSGVISNNLEIEVEHYNSYDQSQNFEESLISNSFIEIAPLDQEIDIDKQKDLSSIPIDDIVFPNVVFMIVDKQIELEIKILKDYPEWHFLPKKDLDRKTIEIYEDQKNAKRFCKKDQKVIKVPNTDVFKMVAPILISKGISRIINSDKLIAL
tara:strand:- start:386 stop:1054 length:669 start_codon:yes stop_codon:yes gene_type:complete